ncbi:hypothetical protein [Haloarchaeobius sp. TZWSO28]|uniref:hypothetical protein n=1 Tax=Haloarchaeobius sp. TZWSO28 TaxID=3446119 RepID=UPI003EB88435
MPFIDSPCRLEEVEHIEASGTGTLDFAVANRNVSLTWDGVEDADWVVEGVAKVENIDEDRILLYPQGKFFICDIEADREEGNLGPVRCHANDNSE